MKQGHIMYVWVGKSKVTQINHFSKWKWQVCNWHGKHEYVKFQTTYQKLRLQFAMYNHLHTFDQSLKYINIHFYFIVDLDP